MPSKIVLATCQFRIEKQVRKNLASIARQMRYAKKRGAHLVHFSEACLSGYLGVELKSVREVKWNEVRAAMKEILALARELKLWAVVGCNHELSGKHKPHNSLYVIDDRGKLVSRYDKMFCAGDDNKSGDLKHYSPGEDFIVFKVRGVRCGLLICHDFRYPELFRAYKKRGVELMLVSFHNAGMTRKSYDHYSTTVPATLQASAASNFFAVSANNSTRRQAWPSFVVRPDGIVVNRAPAHRDTVLITTIAPGATLFDASVAWRKRCMAGTYHSGRLVKDLRSHDRKSL